MKKFSIIIFIISLLFLTSCSMEYGTQYKYGGYLFEYLEDINDGVMFSGLDDGFSKNVYIDTLYIPESIYNQKVVVIGNKENGNYKTLQGGENIKKVVVPNTVRYINGYAFQGWKIKTITLGNNISFIGSYAFSNCYSLEKIEIPESVKKINTFSFYNCHNLKEVVFPETLTSIGASSFRYCWSLTKIEIPENVDIIDSAAFSGCTKLKSITLKCKTPPKGTGDIPLNEDLKIYVPENSLDTYKNDGSWSNYAKYFVPSE